MYVAGREKYSNQVTNDLAKYSNKNQHLSDVILNVDDVKFPAHKLILSARSPVFAAMFQHDMKENQKNSVDIPDIKSDVFEVALQFIYTGDVTRVDKFAVELLSVADKYQLRFLKTVCQDHINDELSPSNACKSLVLADLHSAEKLKKRIIQYINHKKKKLIGTAAWLELKSSYPRLLAELYEDFLLKESSSCDCD